MKKTAIQYTRAENYPKWYLEVIREADLAENSSVKGCIIFKPWGYALWENMQRALDKMFKDTGHENAYFPLFIPLSSLQKEADHVEGFATECAVVTHHKLVKNSQGELVPDGELAEPLIVRPTSETIIGEAFAKWVESYRDLPILINQWANVVRWEMRTRPFLRTTEFLWQEGHTVHASSAEAEKETMKMLEVYRVFLEEFLAIPVIVGKKSESEKFPGAVDTYSVEAMMQNRKALQAGTSHYLGQNFAKASGISFVNSDGQQQYAYTTSWGVSTRMIGALIMSHSDDNGLVLPPRIAPLQVVIIPIYKNPDEKKSVMAFIKKLTKGLAKLKYANRDVLYKIDDRDMRGGEKSWHWIKKGVPLKLEIGPRDVAGDSVAVVRRDDLELKKNFVAVSKLLKTLPDILADIQDSLFQRAEKLLAENSTVINDKKKFYDYFTSQSDDDTEIHGGFVHAHWCGEVACEDQINKDLSVSIRNIPLDAKKGEGRCIYCGKEGVWKVIFAKAY